MTTTPADTGLRQRIHPGRAALRAVAIAACVPYLGLKISWIAGSRVGIPDGSALLDHRVLMALANSVTVLMDGAVVVLAMLLTRPWGLRVRAWLLTVPMWGATGLLAPIMVGFPLQQIGVAFGGTRTQDSAEPFLHDWVFAVVYGGFILQGLALGTLFVLYAKDRWGHLWRGKVWDLPTGVTGAFMRRTAVAGSLLALFPAVMHGLWATGSTVALSAERAAQRTTDFYLLEATRIGFIGVAVTGVLLLAFRLRPTLSVRSPLAMAWVGSSALGAWGGWMLLASLMPDGDEGKSSSALLVLTYIGEMITGLLLTCAVASLLRRRGA
ncbi:hypothetical protein ABZ070_32345 [Streptomyces sp. NPDC006283]|uniref:hypothetical protein n=1 Tax=Streptomyces sp. NPDC006283 TaxID=3156741 RepID=UPI0033AE017D